jgi:hypothetical protein
MKAPEIRIEELVVWQIVSPVWLAAYSQAILDSDS